MEGYEAAVRSYLSECFARGVTPRVAELAARFGLSPWAFTRRFERAHGQSPGAVLREAQVRQAALLLAETEAPMRFVARRSGFASTRAFHRAFRRATGSTPNSFRGANGTSERRLH